MDNRLWNRRPRERSSSLILRVSARPDMSPRAVHCLPNGWILLFRRSHKSWAVAAEMFPEKAAMSRSIEFKSSSRFVAEEVANQWTHGIGFAVSLPAGWWLVRSALDKHNDSLTLGCAVYAVTLSLLHAASTLSHSVHRGVWRHRFRTLDQICIFLLIAGNFTPFAMTFLTEGWRRAVLPAMWVFAVAGIVAKLFVTKLHAVAPSFYLLMGWVPILLLPEFFRHLGSDGVTWIVTGGVAYSAGIWFLINDERRFHHAIWHLFTMLGSACHYVLALNYIVPCG